MKYHMKMRKKITCIDIIIKSSYLYKMMEVLLSRVFSNLSCLKNVESYK